MKNKKPLTLECIERWKPSPENPMRVECLKGEAELCIITGIIKNKVGVIDETGQLQTKPEMILKFYASPYQEEEIVTLYECFGGNSFACYFVTEDFRHYDFERSELAANKSFNYAKILKNKTGRSVKINVKTGEVLSDSE